MWSVPYDGNDRVKLENNMKKYTTKHIFDEQEAKYRASTTFVEKQKNAYFNICVDYINNYLKSEDDFHQVLEDLWSKAEERSNDLGTLITSMEYAQIIVDALATVYNLASFSFSVTNSISKHVVDYTNVLRKTAYNPFYPNRKAYERAS